MFRIGQPQCPALPPISRLSQPGPHKPTPNIPQAQVSPADSSCVRPTFARISTDNPRVRGNSTNFSPTQAEPQILIIIQNRLFRESPPTFPKLKVVAPGVDRHSGPTFPRISTDFSVVTGA